MTVPTWETRVVVWGMSDDLLGVGCALSDRCCAANSSVLRVRLTRKREPTDPLERLTHRRRSLGGRPRRRLGGRDDAPCLAQLLGQHALRLACRGLARRAQRGSDVVQAQRRHELAIAVVPEAGLGV